MGEHTHTHKHKNIHKHVFTDIIICSTEPSKIQRIKAPCTTKIHIETTANAVKNIQMTEHTVASKTTPVNKPTSHRTII